jgi:endonuclease III-like uncharacterized protein
MTDNIKINLKGVGFEGVDYIYLYVFQERDQLRLL